MLLCPTHGGTCHRAKFSLHKSIGVRCNVFLFRAVAAETLIRFCLRNRRRRGITNRHRIVRALVSAFILGVAILEDGWENNTFLYYCHTAPNGFYFMMAAALRGSLVSLAKVSELI